MHQNPFAIRMTLRLKITSSLSASHNVLAQSHNYITGHDINLFNIGLDLDSWLTSAHLCDLITNWIQIVVDYVVKDAKVWFFSNETSYPLQSEMIIGIWFWLYYVH